MDLCCIQFRQGCGKECDGVAEGYSTIQINEDGNMVLCSNVGGICECSEVGDTTDVLEFIPADPGVAGPYYQHTAVDGLIQTIITCKRTSVEFNRPPGATDDPCDTSGLGSFCTDSVWVYDPTQPGADTATNGLCVRKWHRSGGNCNTDEWVEQIVPEGVDHVIGIGAGLGQQEFTQEINPKDTWNDIGNALTVEITNPSTCYDMHVLASFTNPRVGFLNTNPAIVRVGGGAELYFDGVPQGPNTWATALVDATNGLGISAVPSGLSFNAPALVPPGGTFTMTLQPIVYEDTALGVFNGNINIATWVLILTGIIMHPV